MLLNETISVSLTGNSTTGLAVSLTPAFALKNAQAADYMHNSFVVNPTTVAGTIGLGLIASGQHLFVVTDGLVTLTITQNATDRTVDVQGAFLLDGPFTALKVSNASATTAVNMTVFATGERAPLGMGPGVYSLPV